jgi:aspartate aminotransferase-like enzyme
LDSKDGERLRLFTPGPVDLCGAAKRALARDVIHHRSDLFRQALTELEEHLRAVFLTRNPVATLTSSGTGAMEAAVVNLFSPGERVLVPISGKFSARWAELCAAYGIEVCRMDLEPGQSPSAEDVVDRLTGDRGAAGVLLTHCETSTGSLTDVGRVCRAIAEAAKLRGRRFTVCVDCVTSLAIDEFRMDEWNVDCAIGASQKGLLSPPGLAFVSMSPEAVERMSRVSGARYYFDLRRYFTGTASPPFTPAVSLVCAVNEALKDLLALGLPAIWAAYRASSNAVRLTGEAAGLTPVAASQAGGVVAFWLNGLDAERLAAALRERHGIVVAQGQGSLRGRIVRVSPIGKGPAEIRAFARALASVLGDMGRSLCLEDIASELDRILEDSRVWESLPS